jgi:uncharacterized protein
MGRAGAAHASSEVTVLGAAYCWALLRENHLGRVAILAGERPHIFPVNYVAGDGALVFRTGPGIKLDRGPGSISCIEIDGFEPGAREGWSVMAFGKLHDITTATDERSASLRRLQVEPQAPGVRVHWIAMEVEEVSGRWFTGGWLVPGNFLG